MSDAISDLGQAAAASNAAIGSYATQLAQGRRGNSLVDVNVALAGAAKAGLFTETLLAAVKARIGEYNTVTQK